MSVLHLCVFHSPRNPKKNDRREGWGDDGALSDVPQPDRDQANAESKPGIFFKKRINNNHGVVLAMVLVMTIVLSLVILSIVQLQSSQMITAQSVIDTIKSKELALGYFYQDYQRKMDQCALCPVPEDCNSCPPPQPVVLDDKTYTPQIRNQPGVGPEGTDNVNISITY